MPNDKAYDLLIIGGGINGSGIACDAAGRGLSVALCEQGDLAGQTSSASSKMIHGGLRYLEHGEFRLVREALQEREVLMRNAPHLVAPLRLILPHTPDQRPAWMIHVGLLLYDHLGNRETLSSSKCFRLANHPARKVFKPAFKSAFAYSDCRVDDSRLVIANALTARKNGAEILTRHRLERAQSRNGQWLVSLRRAESGDRVEISARALVNTAGTAVEAVLNATTTPRKRNRVRLVKGSHIVVPRFFEGAEGFLLQNPDGRVIFVIPFEQHYSIIGTTDVPIKTPEDGWAINPAETRYLCEAVNRYFQSQLIPDDVVWSFSGVRSLFDDGESDPSAVTRDYVLELDAPANAPPVLSVFGGKITTYRRLAEAAMDRLGAYFPGLGRAWTAGQPLAGGDLTAPNLEALSNKLKFDYPKLPRHLLQALARRHGGWTTRVLDRAHTTEDLGPDFGGGLTGREVDYLMREEWAKTPEDILWRRTKSGLHIDAAGRQRLEKYMATRTAVTA